MKVLTEGLYVPPSILVVEWVVSTVFASSPLENPDEGDEWMWG